MSTIIMAACWPVQMPPTAKSVLMSLADNANDHGVCWPSVNTICVRTCLGRTAVLDAVAWLEGAGILVAERTTGRANRYQIVLNGDLFHREKPVRLADRSASRTSPPPEQDQSASRTGPVRQADPNRKEPTRTVKKNIRPEDLDLTGWPSQPSPQVLADWIAHRKAKRAPITPTVIAAFGREIAKVVPHGFDADAVLAKCMNRNWQGFEAEWLLRDLPGAGSDTRFSFASNRSPSRQAQAIAAARERFCQPDPQETDDGDQRAALAFDHDC